RCLVRSWRGHPTRVRLSAHWWRAVGRRVRRMCRGGIDLALMAEIGDELLAQPVDLLLEQVEQGRRRLLVAGRKRARASAQPLQQHFTVTNRTQAHREPAKLSAKGLGPSRVEQRTERPHVATHLA